MTNRLDESTAQELARVLSERFGDPIDAVKSECDKCDREKLTCKKCGGMLNVNEDVCTQCGMMPEAVNEDSGMGRQARKVVSRPYGAHRYTSR